MATKKAPTHAPDSTVMCIESHESEAFGAVPAGSLWLGGDDVVSEHPAHFTPIEEPD